MGFIAIKKENPACAGFFIIIIEFFVDVLRSGTLLPILPTYHQPIDRRGADAVAPDVYRGTAAFREPFYRRNEPNTTISQLIIDRTRFALYNRNNIEFEG